MIYVNILYDIKLIQYNNIILCKIYNSNKNTLLRPINGDMIDYLDTKVTIYNEYNIYN